MFFHFVRLPTVIFGILLTSAACTGPKVYNPGDPTSEAYYLTGLLSCALGDGNCPAPEAVPMLRGCSLNRGTRTIAPDEPSLNIPLDTTGNEDRGLAIVGDYDYLFIAGYEDGGGDTTWRMEKRRRDTLDLVGEFGGAGFVLSNPSGLNDRARDIAYDGEYIYVLGFDETNGFQNWPFRIEKRDAFTGALVSAFGTGGVIISYDTTGRNQPRRILLHNDALYIVGGEPISNGNTSKQWRIEKRDATTGAYITAFNGTGIIRRASGAGSQSDAYYAAIHDGRLYVGGSDATGALTMRVDSFDLTSGTPDTSFHGDGRVDDTLGSTVNTLSDIRADTTGVYFTGAEAGLWYLRKLTPVGDDDPAFGTSGEITVNLTGGAEQAVRLAVDDAYLYAAGYDNLIGNRQLRLEKRNRLNGALDSGFGSGGVYNLNLGTGNDQIDAMCADEYYIYFAARNNNTNWNLVKINKLTGQ